MSLASYGFGRDVDNLGSITTYGFGILQLFPDGIITIVTDIVHREMRLCIIRLEE